MELVIAQMMGVVRNVTKHIEWSRKVTETAIENKAV